MSPNRRRILLARLWFLAAFLLLGGAVLSAAGFDGVVVLGLNADLGEARRGQDLIQRIRVFNCTLRQVDVLTVPTCGCTAQRSEGYELRPFSSAAISTEYRVGRALQGRVERDSVIVYRLGGAVNRVAGKAHFTVRQ